MRDGMRDCQQAGIVYVTALSICLQSQHARSRGGIRMDDLNVEGLQQQAGAESSEEIEKAPQAHTKKKQRQNRQQRNRRNTTERDENTDDGNAGDEAGSAVAKVGNY